MIPRDKTEEIENLIESTQIEEAIDELIKQIDQMPFYKNKGLILKQLKVRKKELDNKVQLGALSNKDRVLEHNQITSSLIAILEEISASRSSQERSRVNVVYVFLALLFSVLLTFFITRTKEANLIINEGNPTIFHPEDVLKVEDESLQTSSLWLSVDDFIVEMHYDTVNNFWIRKLQDFRLTDGTYEGKIGYSKNDLIISRECRTFKLRIDSSVPIPDEQFRSESSSGWMESIADSTFRVIANVLNCRKSPNIHSPVVARLPHETSVKVIESTEKIDTIYGKIGTWVKVQKGEIEGYVLDTYLDQND